VTSIFYSGFIFCTKQNADDSGFWVLGSGIVVRLTMIAKIRLMMLLIRG
jgi:hypothetical protein